MAISLSDRLAKQPPHFPVLEIKAFLDATTVVLLGSHSDDVREGDELYILGIGEVTIPGTHLPLIAPKATLEVTLSAGEFVLARTPVEEKTVAGPWGGLLAEQLFSATRTIERRPPLIRDEKQFVGNPRNSPIRVGDVVVPHKLPVCEVVD